MRAQRSSSVAASSGDSLLSERRASERFSDKATLASGVRDNAPAAPSDFRRKDLRVFIVFRLMTRKVHKFLNLHLAFYLELFHLHIFQFNLQSFRADVDVIE